MPLGNLRSLELCYKACLTVTLDWSCSLMKYPPARELHRCTSLAHESASKCCSILLFIEAGSAVPGSLHVCTIQRLDLHLSFLTF